ncbi:uncharacterized protein PAC_13533 [Phialocephala subalpina]|uniref:Uncharacterized protein n=1 Tax=Phialocephala subalpina TaxID=576137 RepID=A0A1L7XF87_9HELO|nr:uncharacterized protein PAC_13533 [Phialocephala subalpina]
MTESLYTKPHQSIELTETHRENEKFTSTLLARTIRVGGPQSGLVSWPPITIQETHSQMKGIFHYVAESVASQVLQDSETRKAIEVLIGNTNPDYFNRVVPPVFTTFIENLVLEANSLLEIAKNQEGLRGKSRSFFGRIRYSKVERELMNELSRFKAQRRSVGELLGMIWEHRAPIWDFPKQDNEGRNYWASNVEWVRGSKAMEGLKIELRGLRKDFVGVEAV